MPDWKRTNFEVLEDRSPADVPMRWLFARTALESPELGVSRFVYEPGARMPFAHRHREQEEAYVVVAGSAARTLTGRCSSWSPGTCCASGPRWCAPSRREPMASS
jgi:mannose-6-phosphate isomerase-like protein (cupin superfamily)